MTEAERYTPEMWKRALGAVISILLSSDTRRRAFVSGFNGEPVKGIHYSARDAWARGLHTSILLGYIPEDPQP